MKECDSNLHSNCKQTSNSISDIKSFITFIISCFIYRLFVDKIATPSPVLIDRENPDLTLYLEILIFFNSLSVICAKK